MKLNRYKDDILFFLFYTNVGDVLQLAAAAELHNRDWRYHKVYNTSMYINIICIDTSRYLREFITWCSPICESKSYIKIGQLFRVGLVFSCWVICLSFILSSIYLPFYLSYHLLTYLTYISYFRLNTFLSILYDCLLSYLLFM